jgi:hypothetical protein
VNDIPAIPGTSPFLEGSAKVEKLRCKKEEIGIFFEEHLHNELKINKNFDRKFY